MNLPQKPREGSKCNGCGICCMISLCPIGVKAFGAIDGPCPALEVAHDRTYCQLIRRSEHISKLLGVGRGCDCSDDGETFIMQSPDWVALKAAAALE